MYLEHFGLKEYPFRLTPDVDFLYMSSAHARAKAYMDYSVWNREGFVVITGDVGCGKTTLIQKLLSELNDEEVLIAKIFQTQLDDVEFLQAVLVEFGLNPFNAKKVELMDMLNTFLIENFHKGRQAILIVDEAHKMSAYSSEKKTLAYHLGEALSNMTDHYLLMTATPHKGDPDNFTLFLQLLDQDAYADVKSIREAMNRRRMSWLPSCPGTRPPAKSASRARS